MFSYCTFWVIVCERYSNLFFSFVLLFMLILHSASFSLSVLLSVVETIPPSPAAARVMFCVSPSWGHKMHILPQIFFPLLRHMHLLHSEALYTLLELCNLFTETMLPCALFCGIPLVFGILSANELS